MNEEHAVLAPSDASIWGNCSGSIMARANRPDRTNQTTEDGTAAHWVGSECLTTGGQPEDYIGRAAPNGVIVDEVMAEGAGVYVRDVLDILTEHGGNTERLNVEQRVQIPYIHPTLNHGTPDCWFYDPAARVVFLWDYKHGHREVRAAGNLQLVDYMAGIKDLLELDDQTTRVVFRIVQPFCYHSPGGPVDEWSGTLSDLRGYWNKLRHNAAEAFISPKLTTGLWCRDCLARADCTARRRATYNFIDLADEPYQMDAMTGADLAAEREILRDGIEVAKKRLEAIEDTLHAAIAAGSADTGLALETVPGRETWNIPPAQAIALAAQFGVDAGVQAVLTPNQTRQKAPKEIRPLLAATMKQYASRPAGALKLTPADESRTARAFKRR